MLNSAKETHPSEETLVFFPWNKNATPLAPGCSNIQEYSQQKRHAKASVLEFSLGFHYEDHVSGCPFCGPLPPGELVAKT